MHEKCDDIKILIVKYTDDQISGNELKTLNTHVDTCRECRQDLESQTEWKGVSEAMKNQLLPDMAWDEYWQNLYNKMERGVSWIFISIGAILLIGYAVVNFMIGILNDTDISLFEKIGIVSLSIGFVVLFISVVREKLMARRYDKYKEIQR